MSDFVELSTFPVRILTPVGRFIDNGLDMVSGTKSYFNGTSDWIGKAGGLSYSAFVEMALKPVHAEWAGRLGAMAGKPFESVVNNEAKR